MKLFGIHDAQMTSPFLKLTDERIKAIQGTARYLAPQIREIVHHWEKAYREMDPTIDPSALDEMKKMYRAFFMMLLEGMDIRPFEDRIRAVAKRLCQMEVSFDAVVLSLHLIEDTCLPYIKEVYSDKERLVEAMVAMDYMCHACFSTIASSYFHEKYARAARSPQQEKGSAEFSQRYGLTPRELEILKWITDGYKNHETADHLKISLKTVEHHRANLMRKLGVHNVVDLTKLAMRNQLA